MRRSSLIGFLLFFLATSASAQIFGIKRERLHERSAATLPALETASPCIDRRVSVVGVVTDLPDRGTYACLETSPAVFEWVSIGGSGGSSPGISMLSLIRTTAHTVGNLSISEPLVYSDADESADTDGWRSGTDSPVFTAPSTGTYMVTVWIEWDGSGVGSRSLTAVVNSDFGTQHVLDFKGSAPAIGFLQQSGSKELSLTTGDDLKFYGIQDSGGNLDIRRSTVRIMKSSGGGTGFSPVDSVHGRTGSVISVSGDYACSEVTGCVDGAITSVATIADIDASVRSGLDTTIITGTAGVTGNCAEFNSDGDLIDAGAACSGGSPDSIEDADGDTRVETEQAADEDVVRVTAGGSETLTVTSSSVQMTATSASVATICLNSSCTDGIQWDGGTARWVDSGTEILAFAAGRVMSLFNPGWRLYNGVGSVAAPCYSISNDSNTGWCGDGADLGFLSAGGTRAMNWTVDGPQLVSKTTLPTCAAGNVGTTAYDDSGMFCGCSSDGVGGFAWFDLCAGCPGSCS